ncbi:hypothetical protein [Lentilactobacillus sunkii]|uniref:Bacteriocin n=1 Tax=Lentilactobacillus sunkii DSM 19904 TaxID=1423808 RepID=A0A0R1L0Z5_9LACO|nr:hypothetical protein [Lentilactobacillus sunkii]KRK89550.1 hypothetical protein FD17_GL001139 [Lentilactobacillus sunkii DSM 19904]
MKTKTMIATGLLTAGLGLGAVSTTANAASWHKGTPSALRGKWKTKPWTQSGYKYDYRSFISAHKIISEVRGLNGGPSDMAAPTVQHARYKYLGNHLYKFKGTSLGTSPSSCYIKWKSHNHIVIKPWSNNKVFSYYRY